MKRWSLPGPAAPADRAAGREHGGGGCPGLLANKTICLFRVSFSFTLRAILSRFLSAKWPIAGT